MNLNSDCKGIASEAMVEQALVTIQNTRRNHDVGIASYVHASRHSDLDRNHIDFQVNLLSGERVPIQVKSSDRGKRRFERKLRKSGMFIPVVVVHAGDSLQLIVRQVIECIRLAINYLKRKINWHTHIRRSRQMRRNKHFYRPNPAICH